MKSENEIRNNVNEGRRLDPQLNVIATQIGAMVRNESIILLGKVDYYVMKLSERAAQPANDVKVQMAVPKP